MEQNLFVPLNSTKKPQVYRPNTKTTTMAAPLHRPLLRRLRATTLPVLLSLCLLLSSCTTSLYPLAAKDSEAVFRPELIGTWEQPDDYGGGYMNLVRVQKAEGALYRLTTIGWYFTRSGDTPPDTNYLLARLIPVGEYLFLDCVADRKHPSTAAKEEYVRLGHRPVHYICRLVLRNQNEVLELWELNASDELRQILRKKKAAFYAQSDNTLLLLEPPARLKELLVQLAREEARGVWEQKILLRPDPGAAEPEQRVSGGKPAR